MNLFETYNSKRHLQPWDSEEPDTVFTDEMPPAADDQGAAPYLEKASQVGGEVMEGSRDIFEKLRKGQEGKKYA